MSALRIGQGWDNHRIEAGRPMILGGIHIPGEFGLAGHSDADVVFHSLADAILGALALGDIGMHFPDNDPEWRDAESRRFVRHAIRLAAEAGWRLVNVDCTVVLERPKLKDFRAAIRSSVADALHLEETCVSIKFKTAEQMGPVGEGRSCEAQAVALLERISSPLQQ